MDVLFGSPLNTAPIIMINLGALGSAIGGSAGTAAAAVSAGFVITCVYEFSDCIQHLNFKPRSKLLRCMKELHRVDHVHDEMGNFGITSFAVDRMFGPYYAAARARRS